VLRAAPPRKLRPRVYVSAAADAAEAAQFRRLGYATVAALGAEADPAREARRLGCSHILEGGEAVPLQTASDDEGG
jgi:ATP phosphoribosyltransferase regulatory subunit